MKPSNLQIFKPVNLKTCKSSILPIFKTMVMVMAGMAVAVCVSCKKDNSETTNGRVGAYIDNSGTMDGHEYVDLGLPSGTMWATCNVGANKPEDRGDYFAWGETTTKDTYTWATYKWCDGSENSLKKYNTRTSYGKDVDGKTELDPQDDVAHLYWKGNWRTPTVEQIKELKDECKWTWKKNYYLVMGKNGRSIILPAAGYRFDDKLIGGGTYGFYWSSSLFELIPQNAYSTYFHSSSMKPDGVYPRFRGCPIRPVCKP